MFPNFTEFDIAVSPDITIHGVKGGSGPPLLLIHGFPENHRMWHAVAPELASSYSLVIPDLRGYGQSSHPAGDDAHHVYSKRAMAADMVGMMQKLGFTQFGVCGHDRGGRVAHRLAVDHPKAVTKVMVLDIAPTLAMYESTNFRFAKAYFHWFFLIQPKPLPEDLITASGGAFFERTKFMGFSDFHPDAEKTYIAQLNDWDTCHAMCEDYRASASVDLDQAREDIRTDTKVMCPLKCIWAKKGVVEKMFKPLELWQQVSALPVEGEAVDSGHYIPEELPQDTVRYIEKFFV